MERKIRVIDLQGGPLLIVDLKASFPLWRDFVRVVRESHCTRCPFIIWDTVYEINKNVLFNKSYTILCQEIAHIKKSEICPGQIGLILHVCLYFGAYLPITTFYATGHG